jgi:hypothetical protein
MSDSGIDAAPQTDGTVVITASANGKSVKLRVTREYARRLAARLVAASMDANAAEPSVIDRFADLFTKRGKP